jgi:hypothetical protein
VSPQPRQPQPQAAGPGSSDGEGRPGQGGREEGDGVLAPPWELEVVKLDGVCVLCASDGHLGLGALVRADLTFSIAGQLPPWDPPPQWVKGFCLG